MKISELINYLEALKNKEGDREILCTTAPFNDGEIEQLNRELITYSEFNNGFVIGMPNDGSY